MSDEPRTLGKTDTFLVGAGSAPGARVLRGLDLLDALADGAPRDEEPPSRPREARHPLTSLAPPPGTPWPSYARNGADFTDLLFAGETVLLHSRPEFFDALPLFLRRLYALGKEKAYQTTGYLDQRIRELSASAGGQACVFDREGILLATHEDQVALSQLRSAWAEGIDAALLADTENPSVESVEHRRAAFQTLAHDTLMFACLLGWLDQGIVQVTWSTPPDESCPLCVALNGQPFAIEKLLSTGQTRPISRTSHGLCRCEFRPVIAYVVTRDSALRAAESHPRAFLRGESLFNPARLSPESVVIEEVNYGVTRCSKLPAEHRTVLGDLIRRYVVPSAFRKYAPFRLYFVRDIYELDDFQASGLARETRPGEVLVWQRPGAAFQNDYVVSAFATEYDPIEVVYLRIWACEIWTRTPALQSSWASLFRQAPEVIKADPLPPEMITRLLAHWGPFPLLTSYYVGGEACVGIAPELRRMTPEEFGVWYRTTPSLYVAERDTLAHLRGRRQLWSRQTGEAKSAGITPRPDHFLFAASFDPFALFRESLVRYVLAPGSLKAGHPRAYAELDTTVFQKAVIEHEGDSEPHPASSPLDAEGG